MRINRRQFLKFMGAGIALCVAPSFDTYSLSSAQRKFFIKGVDVSSKPAIAVWQRKFYNPCSNKVIKSEWSTDGGLTWNDVKLPIMIEL